MSPRPAILSAALLLAAPFAAASPVTWNTGDGATGSTYDVIVNNSVSWDAARAAAQASGGDLATIDSAAEQSFVESVLNTNVAATGSYWFGIREASEGVWQDVNGKALSYTNWPPGEPDNAASVENVGAILWTNGTAADPAQAARKGKWNDAPNSGYPVAGLITPPLDALRAGFLVEIPGDSTGGGTDGGGTDDGGTDNGGTNAVPLPAAVFTFPAAAGFAGLFYRRMRRAGC
jgi:hypothetical protein